MKLIWSPQARSDLIETYRYVAADNPQAARRLHATLLQGAALLRDNPYVGRPGRVPGTREWVIAGTPYAIPYQVREDRVELLRVYHAARRWPEGFD
jgi:addiction module RelE/StbE family toxin